MSPYSTCRQLERDHHAISATSRGTRDPRPHPRMRSTRLGVDARVGLRGPLTSSGGWPGPAPSGVVAIFYAKHSLLSRAFPPRARLSLAEIDRGLPADGPGTSTALAWLQAADLTKELTISNESVSCRCRSDPSPISEPGAWPFCGRLRQSRHCGGLTRRRDEIQRLTPRPSDNPRLTWLLLCAPGHPGDCRHRRKRRNAIARYQRLDKSI